MTRYLSQSLGAPEPAFGHSIEELERASGRPSADIRLSSEIMQRVRTKLAELGLDPSDTTGPELYNALHERLKHDELTVRHTLNIALDASANEVLTSVQQFLTKHDAPKRCYALKLSVAKRLLKKKMPKAVMKALGYRSVDSLLKHEPVAQILALAELAESATWLRAYHAQYAKLSPTDFESREIAIFAPQSQRWVKAVAAHVTQARHNILHFKELGAVVILPLETAVDGLAITSILLVLTYLNDIRAYSSYMKLRQVKQDFGAVIKATVDAEPLTSARLLGQPVPWRMIQQFYGRINRNYHPEVFEPHIQPEDLSWYNAEDALAAIAPQLAFWQDTQHLCALHEGQPVSMNMLDVALSFCNHLHFTDRIVHFVRDRLWHELMMRYLNQENLEAAVTQQLSSELVEGQPLAS
jgi:hypothetical protein